MAHGKLPPFDDNLRLAEVVHLGVPAAALRETAEEFGIGILELADVLQLPRRTVTRRLAQKKLLTPAESERILRVRRLLGLAGPIFESGDLARRWFVRPLRALGGKSPLQLCSSEPGGREVESVLGRIDHGVIG
jgi:putative toxin-antitoxin system antitoxin component (TIGR02293 family)